MPFLVSGVLAALVLGPALGRGVVLAYDLAWSPDPRLTPFALGVGTPAPRAVPSDAAGVVLGWLVGAGPAQALVLWGTLVLAGVGSARLAAELVPHIGLFGRCAAVVLAVWNPFVLERLVVGQWTVLIGYAAVPHLLVAAGRVRRGTSPVWVPAVGVAGCGVGGANSLAIGAFAALVVLVTPRPRWLALALTAAAALGASAVWSLPALTADVVSAPAGAAAFAARADTPLGVLGSLVSGGGFWNPATHPAGRALPLVGLAAGVLAFGCVVGAVRAARREHLLAVVAPAVLGLGLAWLSALDPFGLWSALVVHVPGGGVLRDAQKLVAPWVAVMASGAGVLVHDLSRARGVGPAVAALVAALPVVLLPSLAWGVGGRLSAVEVPPDLRSVATTLSTADSGTVGLLPWSQYRRYGWNDDRVSLTLVPRLVDQQVLFDDSLPLATGTIPGEDPGARDVGSMIADGVSPFDALAAHGVRWVLVEKRTGLPDNLVGAPRDPPANTSSSAPVRVIADGPSARLYELTPGGIVAASPRGYATTIGWLVTASTWLAATACLLVGTARRKGYGLVSSRP